MPYNDDKQPEYESDNFSITFYIDIDSNVLVYSKGPDKYSSDSLCNNAAIILSGIREGMFDDLIVESLLNICQTSPEKTQWVKSLLSKWSKLIDEGVTQKAAVSPLKTLKQI